MTEARKQGRDSIEKNPHKNPAKNPAVNPAESTKKEGPFQYCLSHPDSIDQKGQDFHQDFHQDFFSIELRPRFVFVTMLVDFDFTSRSFLKFPSLIVPARPCLIDCQSVPEGQPASKQHVYHLHAAQAECGPEAETEGDGSEGQ